MTQVTLRVDSAKVTARLNDIVKNMPKKLDKAVNMTAQQGINIIQDRTSKGQGVNTRFAPYTPAYAKFRQMKGRKVSPVDLNFSGRMLASMTTDRVGVGYYKILFGRAVEAAKAAGNQQKRRFFGFNSKERKQLGRFFNKALVL